MSRCATVTSDEALQLRRIRNVVRLGRLRRIDADEIMLEKGSVPSTPGRLYVDCSADALERRPVVPVFDNDRITLQTMRACQQVFSAAFTAHVEALTAWLAAARLNLFGVRPAPPDAAMIEADQRIQACAPAAMATLQDLLARGQAAG